MLGFLRGTYLFAGFPEETVAWVAGLFRERRFPRHTLLFVEGEPGDHLYVVRTGSVRVFRTAVSGREKILDLFWPGDFFGEMALLEGGTRSASAETREESVLLLLDRPGFERLTTRYPEVLVRISRVLSQRLRRANVQIEDLVFRDCRSRLARTLLDLTARSAGGKPRGTVAEDRISKHELASLLGVSRETVSRTLIWLQEQGLVRLEGRRVVVLDAARLAAVAHSTR
ncbi:MAG: Crp/Fnr family transcriptional regulator [Desulfotomaculales bacterium]